MALVRSWILGFAKSNKINCFFVVLARYFAPWIIGDKKQFILSFIPWGKGS